MRQLTPFFGNSVVITSIIIGIFLLFLALGYWRGGMYREGFFKYLNRNFMLSLLWIGFGLSYFFIEIFFYMTTFKWRLSYLTALSVYLLFILAPIVYWLGQTIPLSTNLFNQQQRVSHISGHALFISTLGSFLGALLTSLILFQYLGVAWTVVINSFLLFGLIIHLYPHTQLPWWCLLLLGLALVAIFELNITLEKAQFKLTNNYANYHIMEPAPGVKILQINRSNSSMVTPTKAGFPYIEFVRNLLFNQLNLQHKKLLVIGAGGFSLTAGGTNNNEVVYVDIDPAIKELAEQHFLNEAIKGQFVGQDARLFLNQDRSLFDVIFSDAYSHQIAIPPSLLTKDYFQSLKQHLKPEGLLIINLIANPFFNNAYSKRAYNTIHAVFPYCAIVPLIWQDSLVNIIYVCSNGSVDETVYSDNLNSATFDFFSQRRKVGG